MSSITDQLVAMGIDRDIAAAAAAETGNANIDAALALLFEGASGGGAETAPPVPVPPASDEPFKMTIAVNTSLGMSAGKIAAQCCHANLAAYKATVARQTGYELEWAGLGEPTIVLQAASVAQLQSLKEAAEAVGLVACAVRDAGRTEVAAGSLTCCAFGPAPVSVVDSITSSLKLLK